MPAENVEIGRPAEATPGRFSSWKGAWGKGGKVCTGTEAASSVVPVFACGPGSPGNQDRFKRPWKVTQDFTGKSAAASAGTQVKPAGNPSQDEQVLCDDGWFGLGIVATVCDQPTLDAYLNLENEPEIPTTLAVATTAPGARTGTSGGIAQTIADKPLQPSGVVTVAGEASGSAVLSIRAQDSAGVIRELRVDQLGLDGEGVLTAAADALGGTLTIRRPSGRETTEQLTLPPGYLKAAATHSRRGTRVTVSVPVPGTATIVVRRGGRARTQRLKLSGRGPRSRLVKLQSKGKLLRPTRAKIVFRPSGDDRPESATIAVN
ncbi:MAG: hypothetical protein V9E83_04245 [Baekduia sp.]